MESKDEKAELLNILREQALVCKRCKLYRTRTNVVFGEGDVDARVMFIGEGPGNQEDLQGRPFIGRAGEFLTRIIENGMKIKRAATYIANIVKCRPTVDQKMQKDRPPDAEETSTCNPFLLKQIEIIEPRVIITLGNPATRFLLNTKVGITKMRGNWNEFHGIRVMPTFHPSYILRNGGEKSPLRREVWEDIKKVLLYLDQPV